MIDPALTYVLVLCALLCGFTAGWLAHGKKRRKTGLDAWNAPRRDPEPTWGRRGNDIAKGLRR